jgi:hypothetical protein
MESGETEIAEEYRRALRRAQAKIRTAPLSHFPGLGNTAYRKYFLPHAYLIP